MESKLNEKINIMRDLLKSLLNLFIEELKEVKIKEPEYEIGEKVQRIRDSALEYKEKIIKKIEEIAKKVIANFTEEKLNVEKFFYETLQDEVNNYLKKQMDRVVKGDVIVKGLLWGVKWEESIENLYKWEKDTYQGVIKILIELSKKFKAIVEKEKSYLEKRVNDYKIEKRNIIKLEKEIEEEILEFQKEKNEKEAEIKKLAEEITRMRETLKKSMIYKEYLAKEFIAFWNEKVRSLNDSTDCVRILNLLYQLWATQKTLEECCLWAKEEV